MAIKPINEIVKTKTLSTEPVEPVKVDKKEVKADTSKPKKEPKQAKKDTVSLSVRLPSDMYQALEDYRFDTREKYLNTVIVRAVEDFLKRAKK